MGLLGASFCCLKYLSFFPSKTKYRRFQLLRTPPCLSNQPSIVGRPCIANLCVPVKLGRSLARAPAPLFTAVATRKRPQEIIVLHYISFVLFRPATKRGLAPQR